MYVLFPLMVGFGLYSAIFQGALTYDVFSFLMIELRVVVRFFELEALGAGHGGKCCIRISFRWNDPPGVHQLSPENRGAPQLDFAHIPIFEYYHR